MKINIILFHVTDHESWWYYMYESIQDSRLKILFKKINSSANELFDDLNIFFANGNTIFLTNKKK